MLSDIFFCKKKEKKKQTNKQVVNSGTRPNHLIHPYYDLYPPLIDDGEKGRKK